MADTFGSNKRIYKIFTKYVQYTNEQMQIYKENCVTELREWLAARQTI